VWARIYERSRVLKEGVGAPTTFCILGSVNLGYRSPPAISAGVGVCCEMVNTHNVSSNLSRVGPTVSFPTASLITLTTSFLLPCCATVFPLTNGAGLSMYPPLISLRRPPRINTNAILSPQCIITHRSTYSRNSVCPIRVHVVA